MKPIAGVVLLLMALSGTASARECAVIEGGAASLAGVDAGERLSFLRDGLREAAHRARIWSWAWGATYSALTVGQVALGVIGPPEDRPKYFVFAVPSAIAVAALAIVPLKVMRDQRWLEKRIANAAPGEDPCALLAEAERLLLRDAESEHKGQGWLLNVGNFALNLAAGLVLAFAFHNREAAAVNGVVGFALGELQFDTQPTESVKLLARYRANAFGPTAAPTRLGLAPILGGGQYGLALGTTF
jgi:hypothetical protein